MKTWDALLLKAVAPQADKVPARFKTADEWAKHFKKSRRAVDELFKRLKTEERSFHIIAGNRVRVVKHYAL